jgi:cytochrome c-type biogenesis protein CcmH/NrfG
MPDSTPNPSSALWQPKLVYGMAATCLLLGLAVGFLLRGSESQARASNVATKGLVPEPAVAAQMPTLEQMKHIADKQVAPLLEQLNKDPKNKDLLMKAAYSYKSAHQFKDAAAYFDRALQVDPKNVAVRTEMASCLYYDGNVEGALAQLDEALKISPKDANSLFNLGVIRWKGKKDAAGAIHAWQELLQTNPNLDRKPIVERMIAEARQQGRPQ